MQGETLEKLYRKGAIVITCALVPVIVYLEYIICTSNISMWLSLVALALSPFIYLVLMYICMFIWAFLVFGIGCIIDKDIRHAYLDCTYDYPNEVADETNQGEENE